MSLSLVAFLMAQGEDAARVPAAVAAAAPAADVRGDRHSDAADPAANTLFDHHSDRAGPAADARGDRHSSAAPEPEARLAQRHWMLVAWAATACGVLTKGLVAAFIPAAVLVLYSLYTRDFAPWRRLRAAVGLPLFLAITVPWHWLAARREPEFLKFFFVHEHLQRYLTPSADRQEAWWFFGVVFVLGSMPWSWSALRVLASGWRRRRPRGRFDPAVFLWIWVVFVGVFFSLSDSKLIPYLLPALPAVALLVAASSEQALRRDLGLTALGTLLAALGLAATGLYGAKLLADSHRSPYFALLARPLYEIAALLAVSALFVLLRCRRDLTQAAVFIGVGWCLGGLLLMRAAGLVAPLYSGAGLAGAVGTPAAAAPLYTVQTYDQTLPFYWQRTFKLVAYRGELDFGLRRRPEDELPSVAAFVYEWDQLASGYAVLEHAMFNTLGAQGVPMRELARDDRRVVVARR
jgi:4-amino-4-deoxy-L-arabinose transferase-like glycosyltransferase